MTAMGTATLCKLSDTGQSVADADEDVRGRKVKDNAGRDIGKVDDLLVDDEEHKVRFLRVEHGGFLGMGEDKSFIPVDAISRITDDAVYLGHSGDDIAAAPRYDPGLVDKPQYHRALADHYGYRPFWDTQYIYPGYPYYLM